DQIKQRFDSHCGPHAVPRPKSWQSPVPPAICFLIKGKRRDPARDYGACDTHPRFELRNKSMAHTLPGRWRRAHNPLLITSLLLVGTLCLAAGYVGYVLWPRWPAVVSLKAPALPIEIAGVMFDIEPAAIRRSVQRHAGRQERLDLEYAWPSLLPPDPNAK